MTVFRKTPWAVAALLSPNFVMGAEMSILKCEEWHPRLGQLADKSFAIDLTAKTCSGQPCAISEAQFKWSEGNGQYELAFDRASGEGTRFVSGQLVFSYKNCKFAPGQS
jgi:hypothetical protein